MILNNLAKKVQETRMENIKKECQQIEERREKTLIEETREAKEGEIEINQNISKEPTTRILDVSDVIHAPFRYAEKDSFCVVYNEKKYTIPYDRRQDDSVLKRRISCVLCDNGEIIFPNQFDINTTPYRSVNQKKASILSIPQSVVFDIVKNDTATAEYPDGEVHLKSGKDMRIFSMHLENGAFFKRKSLSIRSDLARKEGMLLRLIHNAFIPDLEELSLHLQDSLSDSYLRDWVARTVYSKLKILRITCKEMSKREANEMTAVAQEGRQKKKPNPMKKEEKQSGITDQEKVEKKVKERIVKDGREKKGRRDRKDNQMKPEMKEIHPSEKEMNTKEKNTKQGQKGKAPMNKRRIRVTTPIQASMLSSMHSTAAPFIPKNGLSEKVSLSNKEKSRLSKPTNVSSNRKHRNINRNNLESPHELPSFIQLIEDLKGDQSQLLSIRINRPVLGNTLELFMNAFIKGNCSNINTLCINYNDFAAVSKTCMQEFFSCSNVQNLEVLSFIESKLSDEQLGIILDAIHCLNMVNLQDINFNGVHFSEENLALLYSIVHDQILLQLKGIHLEKTVDHNRSQIDTIKQIYSIVKENMQI